MIKRMMENRGYSSQEALARISAQLPITEKSNRSHYTIVNDSTEEKLFAEAKKLVDWLIERTNHGKQ
jgi:dephospho-CoA kinase